MTFAKVTDSREDVRKVIWNFFAITDPYRKLPPCRLSKVI